MNQSKVSRLSTRLIICEHQLKIIMEKIQEINNDREMSEENRLAELKIIKDKISKVGVEIDNVKNSIKLVT